MTMLHSLGLYAVKGGCGMTIWSYSDRVVGETGRQITHSGREKSPCLPLSEWMKVGVAVKMVVKTARWLA